MLNHMTSSLCPVAFTVGIGTTTGIPDVHRAFRMAPLFRRGQVLLVLAIS
jgi:hypothetical protein